MEVQSGAVELVAGHFSEGSLREASLQIEIKYGWYGLCMTGVLIELC